MPTPRALTSEQKTDLRVVYSAMDRDSDGCVTAKEMLECLRTVQASYSLESVEALMAEVDLKTPGQVTWDEFVLVMEKKLSETTSEAQLFELLDENGNGTINPAELKASLLRFDLDASDQAALRAAVTVTRRSPIASALTLGLRTRRSSTR